VWRTLAPGVICPKGTNHAGECRCQRLTASQIRFGDNYVCDKPVKVTVLPFERLLDRLLQRQGPAFFPGRRKLLIA
jgi:hypothetical protein